MGRKVTTRCPHCLGKKGFFDRYNRAYFTCPICRGRGEISIEVEMNSYPQDSNHTPGSWKKLLLPTEKGEYLVSATFTCPECGRVAALSEHTIAADGTVSPSVVCPAMDCNFHEFIKLEGWTEDGRPKHEGDSRRAKDDAQRSDDGHCETEPLEAARHPAD